MNLDSKRERCKNKEEKGKQMIDERQESHMIYKVTVRPNVSTKNERANLQSMNTKQLEKTALLINFN